MQPQMGEEEEDHLVTSTSQWIVPIVNTQVTLVGQIVKLKPECYDKYKEVHAAIWAEVAHQIKSSNIVDCTLLCPALWLLPLPHCHPSHLEIDKRPNLASRDHPDSCPDSRMARDRWRRDRLVHGSPVPGGGLRRGCGGGWLAFAVAYIS